MDEPGRPTFFSSCMVSVRLFLACTERYWDFVWVSGATIDALHGFKRGKTMQAIVVCRD